MVRALQVPGTVNRALIELRGMFCSPAMNMTMCSRNLQTHQYDRGIAQC